MYDVALHAFCFLANHFHALATVSSAEQMSLFTGFVEGNLAKELGLSFIIIDPAGMVPLVALRRTKNPESATEHGASRPGSRAEMCLLAET